MSDEIQAPAFSLRLPQLDLIQMQLAAVLDGRSLQEWYTVEQAWRRKHAAVIEDGSISLATFKAARAFQPKGGREDGFISNRKVWREASIAEWLVVDDSSLAAYLAKYNPACKIPDRVQLAIKSRRRMERASA